MKPAAFAGQSLIALLSRFSLVGAAATATYLIVSNLFMVSDVTSRPEIASICGYLAGIVVSFVGQSRVTFLVRTTTWGHLARFLILSAVGLIVSYYSVRGSQFLGIAPWWGTIATALFVPAFSFVVMKLWVFRVVPE